MIKSFDSRRLEKEESSPPLEEYCTSDVSIIEEKPSTLAVGASNTLEGGNIASIQYVPKTHRGMHEFRFSNISENLMESLGNLSLLDQGSKHIVDIEKQACTVLYILGLINDGVKNHLNAPLLSCMQH